MYRISLENEIGICCMKNLPGPCHKKNDYITFMASTSIVEATKSPDVEVPASLGIQVEADRSLETVVAASDGSS